MSATIVWFRDDLRIDDNPALSAAAGAGSPVICLYILEDGQGGLRQPGGASRWWLHHSLEALAQDLSRLGASLVLRRGPAEAILLAVAKDAGAKRVVWNRRFGPAERAVDERVERQLIAEGVAVDTFNGTLLHEPDEVRSKAGQPMRVFTPFWSAAKASQFRRPEAAPTSLRPGKAIRSDRVEDFGLLPRSPDWATTIAKEWTPGAQGAAKRVRAFLERHAKGYGAMRDRPDRDATSRLSPHLRFGEFSPVKLWNALVHAEEAGEAPSRDIAVFLRELGWREFSYHLLANAGRDIAVENINRRFDTFPWRRQEAAFEAWTRGMTGYPLVDAGMRQLWLTGWMHNRIRMVTASFLVKHLLIDWRQGEAWFWDTLVDADPANNPASWQWVAGSGADAAPYFRIFNPILQGRTFDPRGKYVRRFVPEIAALPDKHIHAPFAAPKAVLEEAGIRLGETYPDPIVDHKAVRARALAAFQTLKAAA